MSTTTDTTSPSVPPRVRTAVYFLALAVSAAVLLVTGMAAIWTPEHAERIAASGGVITGVVAFVTAGLGVAYRPR